MIAFSIGFILGALFMAAGIALFLRACISYETIDGRWWMFFAGAPLRPMTDREVARIIWGRGP